MSDTCSVKRDQDLPTSSGLQGKSEQVALDIHTLVCTMGQDLTGTQAHEPTGSQTRRRTDTLTQTHTNTYHNERCTDGYRKRPR
eukprot:13768390-Alexandrium_andersonii.AAC.1